MLGSVVPALLLLAWSPPQATEIPRTWDDAEMATFELPLAHAPASPEHVPSAYYYALPVRPIYRTYPVYAPEHEPPGYLDALREKEPEIVFDASKLETEADWIAAGKLVFEAPITTAPVVMTFDNVRLPAWYREVGVPITADGIMPFASYVIREKGKVELGQSGCSTCHTRVMPDGSTVLGAQGNFPFDPSFGWAFSRSDGPPGSPVALVRLLAATPWIRDSEAQWDSLSREDVVAALSSVPDGAVIRQGTSLHYPAKIPDLIGIEDRKYLDATGFVRHRGIGDLMRYAAVNQTLDMLASYGGYIPAGVGGRELPPPGEGLFVGIDSRYSDAQLYALAKFLYSLEPPPNPNPYDERAEHGERIFAREGCAVCHTPPLYTSNTLIPAPGFEPPDDHWETYDILDAEIGTDPATALRTRRGTGYYKVPSLKGVWYRGALQHNGAVPSLEAWFDPARLARVPGHPFGLELSEDERTALIAFLRTL